MIMDTEAARVAFTSDYSSHGCVPFDACEVFFAGSASTVEQSVRYFVRGFVVA